MVGIIKETVSTNQTIRHGIGVKHGIDNGTGHAVRVCVDHGSVITGGNIIKVELIGCADTELRLYHKIYLCPLTPINVIGKRYIAGSFRRCQSLNVL